MLTLQDLGVTNGKDGGKLLLMSTQPARDSKDNLMPSGTMVVFLAYDSWDANRVIVRDGDEEICVWQKNYTPFLMWMLTVPKGHF